MSEDVSRDRQQLPLSHQHQRYLEPSSPSVQPIPSSVPPVTVLPVPYNSSHSQSQSQFPMQQIGGHVVSSTTATLQHHLPSPAMSHSQLSDPASAGLGRATAMQSHRYDPGAGLDVQHNVIFPGTFACRNHPEERVLPSEWMKFTHPEGKVYFYHPRLRIVTEAWIYTPHTLSRIVHWATLVYSIAHNANIALSSTTELCLELSPSSSPSEDEDYCTYYFVDHAHRTEFWVERATTDELEIQPTCSANHLREQLKEHYWRHVEYFPMHIALAEDVEGELQGMLMHACADAMTSDLSTSPISPEKCQAYLQLLQNITVSTASRGHKNCVVARLWGEFARNRFINLHGEENARLCRDQLLDADPESESSALLSVANYVLFGVPESHLGSLKKLWVDDIAYTEHWQRFARLMIREWRECSLGSMVILVTEILLFINLAKADGGSISSSPEMWQSVQQACSLAAILLATVSLLSGVMLTRGHKQYEETHAAEATNFLSDHEHPTLGLRPLATVYAVPFGSFAWSIIFFTTALLLLSFHLKSWLTQVLIWAFCFGIVGFCLLVSGGLWGRWRGLRMLRRDVEGWTSRGRRNGVRSRGRDESRRPSVGVVLRVFGAVLTRLGLRAASSSSSSSSRTERV